MPFPDSLVKDFLGVSNIGDQERRVGTSSTDIDPMQQSPVGLCWSLIHNECFRSPPQAQVGNSPQPHGRLLTSML